MVEDKKEIGFWCYSYYDRDYGFGKVINFLTLESAIEHAFLHHEGQVEESDFYFLKLGEIQDFYQGE